MSAPPQSILDLHSFNPAIVLLLFSGRDRALPLHFGTQKFGHIIDQPETKSIHKNSRQSSEYGPGFPRDGRFTQPPTSGKGGSPCSPKRLTSEQTVFRVVIIFQLYF